MSTHHKPVPELSFDELVTECAGKFLEDILKGTPLRRAIWNVCELTARWQDERKKT